MKTSTRRFFALLSAALATLLFSAAAPAQDRQDYELLVFAAASLSNVLGELSTAFERRTGTHVKLSFAASSALARQIESGANADAFVSADQEWMDYLAQRDLIDKSSRRNLVGNQLVLIAPADSKIALEIKPKFKLAAALGDGRLATGDPDSVPVGKYAKASLTALGVWTDVESKLVRAENVRAAMMYVARGEAPLGIVYRTDALIDPKVRIVDTFPDQTHEPITYPGAVTKVAQPQAEAYLEFLASKEAEATWRKFGFEAVKKK